MEKLTTWLINNYFSLQYCLKGGRAVAQTCGGNGTPRATTEAAGVEDISSSIGPKSTTHAP